MSETTNLKLFKHDNPATNENQFDVTKALNNNWDKIDTFAGTTNTKITENQNNIKSLQTDNTTNKKDIATLKSDNTTNKANIKALQDDNKTNKDNIEELQQKNKELEAENERLRQDMNAYPSNTASGEYITLNDSADSRFNKFKILGKSTQKTRSGKNKLDLRYLASSLSQFISDINIDTGSFTLTNCWSTTIMYAEHIQKFLKPNTQYKMIADVTLLEKPEVLDGYNNNYRLIVLYDGTNTNTILKTSTSTEKNNWEVNFTKHIVTVFTTPEDLSNYDIRSYNYHTEDGGAGKFKYENVMILESAEEDENFEQYGVSPSTLFQSPIQNIDGNINLTLFNKNFLSLPSKYELTGASPILNLLLQPKTYIIQFEDAISSDENTNSYVCLFMLNDNVVKYIHINRENKKVIFTLPSKVNQFRIWSADSDDEAKDVTTIFINLNLYQDGQSANYIEHEEQIYNFPIAKGQVLRERDYLADDGTHHKRKKIELDGTENWFQHPTSKVFSLSVSDIDVEGAFNSSAKIIVMSNYFKASKYYQLYYGEVDEAISGHDSNQAIEIRATRFATTDNFKAWLAQKKAEGNPVTVEYDLKEEETEAYTDEQKQVYDEIIKTAKTYKTVTNIFSTNEVSPKFEVEYRQDIKSLINNVSKAVLNNA